MHIELRHLLYVLTTVELGSFRAAAQSLAVNQSVISRRIRDLEDGIGASLFIRHRSGVSTTLAGQTFLSYARNAVDLIKQAQTEVGAIGRGEDGIIRIGISSSLASGFLAKLIKTFKRTHPAVRLDFIEGSASEHLAGLRQSRLDMTFLTKLPTSQNFNTAHLWDEQIFVALPRYHQLASQRLVEWPHLQEQSFLVGRADPGPELRCLLANKLITPRAAPEIRQYAVQRDTLMQLVALGKGLTLATASMAANTLPEIVFRRLAGEHLPFFGVWSPNNDNPALRRLISIAKALTQTESHKQKNGCLEGRVAP